MWTEWWKLRENKRKVDGKNLWRGGLKDEGVTIRVPWASVKNLEVQHQAAPQCRRTWEVSLPGDSSGTG